MIIDDRDVEKAAIIFEEEFEVASEVDDFWTSFRSEVVSGVRRGQPVVLEVRLSEPPEVRAKIEGQAKAELILAGAAEAGTQVTVISAYKQGYSWLYGRSASGARRENDRSFDHSVRRVWASAGVETTGDEHPVAVDVGALPDRRDIGEGAEA